MCTFGRVCVHFVGGFVTLVFFRALTQNRETERKTSYISRTIFAIFCYKEHVDVGSESIFSVKTLPRVPIGLWLHRLFSVGTYMHVCSPLVIV